MCGNRKYIHRSNDQLRGMKMLVPAECMNEYIDISYEGKQLMITKDYDKVLTISYGANYMTRFMMRQMMIYMFIFVRHF